MGIGILYLNLNNLTEITASIEPIYMIAGILTVIVSFIFGMKQAKYDKKRWKMEKRREEKSKTNFEVEDLNQSRITFCGDQTVVSGK